MFLELEPLLEHARRCRDWGNNILIASLVVEFLLELWPELSLDWSPWTPPNRLVFWADQYRPLRKWITVGAALMVLVGVAIETAWSIRIDNIVDDMRIAGEPRPELLYGQREEKLIAALKAWAGQRIEIRYCKMYFLDGDTMHTAMQLGTILSHAGWVGEPGYQIGAVGSGWIPPRESSCGAGEGLLIQISARAPKQTSVAAEGLIRSLEAVSLEVTSSVNRLSDGEMEPLDPSSVVLTVFAHPL